MVKFIEVVWLKPRDKFLKRDTVSILINIDSIQFIEPVGEACIIITSGACFEVTDSYNEVKKYISASQFKGDHHETA